MKRRAACWCLVMAWAGRIQIIEYLFQKRGALLLLSDSFSLRGVCRIPRNPYTRDKPHRLPRTRVSSHTGFCGIIATTGLNIRIMMVCTQESLNVVTGSEICCSTFAAITPPQRLPPLFFFPFPFSCGETFTNLKKQKYKKGFKSAVSLYIVALFIILIEGEQQSSRRHSSDSSRKKSLSDCTCTAPTNRMD